MNFYDVIFQCTVRSAVELKDLSMKEFVVYMLSLKIALLKDIWAKSGVPTKYSVIIVLDNTAHVF